MDLVAVILFLAMYYLRPQEWHPRLSAFRPVQLTMILGLVALWQREKAVRARDLFRTPHDYAMALFFAWLCFTSGAPLANFKLIANLIVFYFVIVQTLNTVRRMDIYLMWWCAFVLILSIMALSGEYGYDPFSSYNLTHGWMKDRLSLNLSIFNNPNALAHSVVPVIPMLYFLLIWKRPLLSRYLGMGLMAPPLLCIYLTVSKGAFISGFVTTVATLTFGRPRWVQILILSVAIGSGTGALFLLPRMSELHKVKGDEAIQGRVAAYTYGYRCVTTMWAGLGYNMWMNAFFQNNTRLKVIRVRRRLPHNEIGLVRRRVPEHYYKACHGSFNNMGAELGFTGLALFFAMVWCSLRTLIACKVGDNEEERIRRILFVLMTSYLISSWMVDFGYRPTFFMFTAATAAFHRHLRGIHRQQDEEIAAQKAKDDEALWWLKPRSPLPLEPGVPVAEPAAALATAGRPALAAPNLISPRVQPFERPKELVRPLPVWLKKAEGEARPTPVTRVPSWRRSPSAEEMITTGTILWNRLGWLDALMAYLITVGVVRIWGYVIHTM